MKILYDHQIFGFQKFGGISRYFVELMSNLPDDIEFDNSIVFTENEYLRNADSRFNKGIYLPHFKGRNRATGPINKLASEISIFRGKYDIFHPTYYSTYYIGHIKKPVVVTVYDMIHEKFSDMFKPTDKTSVVKRKVITQADKVIAISQHTKDDLIDIYDLPAEKIEVVHLFHSLDPNNVEKVENLPSNYILYVGQRFKYKNFERFAKAFSIIHKEYPDIKVVCTGARFTPSEMEMLQELGISQHFIRLYVTDTQLTYLYQNAICFIYPSLYEGFGIPILESFAAGCPLLLSNTSCFPEIAREGGLYFDPYEIDDIADALKKIISDSSLRIEMINRGKNVLKNYSWEKMASETAEIYRNLI